MDQGKEDYTDPAPWQWPSLRTLAVIGVCGTVCLFTAIAVLFTWLIILHPPVLRD